MEDLKNSMGLDYSKYRKQIRGGTSHREMSRENSAPKASHKMPFGTYTTREGEINKIFDLYKQKEIISKLGKLEPEHQHKPKTNQELVKLKESRKSDKNLESSENLLSSNLKKKQQTHNAKHRSSSSDEMKESFMRMKSNQNSRPFLHEQVGEMARLLRENITAAQRPNELLLQSNPPSLQSDRQKSTVRRNPFAQDKIPQSRSQIRLGEPAPSAQELGVYERAKSRPLVGKKKNKSSLQIKRHKDIAMSSGRGRSGIFRKGKPKTTQRSSSRYDRGLSANLSGLAPATVVSYEGPNVSLVSRRLREKRSQIMDTFAKLNLDMAWVHRQCKYIDLHSTEGVLKFFELQNRLIVKLAGKLRKEKSARFQVEKQCEQLMDRMQQNYNAQ